MNESLDTYFSYPFVLWFLILDIRELKAVLYWEELHWKHKVKSYVYGYFSLRNGPVLILCIQKCCCSYYVIYLNIVFIYVHTNNELVVQVHLSFYSQDAWVPHVK